MALDTGDHRLAAILSADVVGYSRLMALDETATVRTLNAYREQMAVLIRQYRGRVVDSRGDNLLAEFPSALDAVCCAVETQRVLRARNTDQPPDRKMEFRIGIHLGDVMLIVAKVNTAAGQITAVETPPEHVRWGDIPTPLF